MGGGALEGRNKDLTGTLAEQCAQGRGRETGIEGSGVLGTQLAVNGQVALSGCGLKARHTKASEEFDAAPCDWGFGDEYLLCIEKSPDFFSFSYVFANNISNTPVHLPQPQASPSPPWMQRKTFTHMTW